MGRCEVVVRSDVNESWSASSSPAATQPFETPPAPLCWLLQTLFFPLSLLLLYPLFFHRLLHPNLSVCSRAGGHLSPSRRREEGRGREDFVGVITALVWTVSTASRGKDAIKHHRALLLFTVPANGETLKTKAPNSPAESPSSSCRRHHFKLVFLARLRDFRRKTWLCCTKKQKVVCVELKNDSRQRYIDYQSAETVVFIILPSDISVSL